MIHVISKLFSVTEGCLGDSGWLLPERLWCYYAIKHKLTHCYTNMFLDFSPYRNWNKFCFSVSLERSWSSDWTSQRISWSKGLVEHVMQGDYIVKWVSMQGWVCQVRRGVICWLVWFYPLQEVKWFQRNIMYRISSSLEGGVCQSTVHCQW